MEIEQLARILAQSCHDTVKRVRCKRNAGDAEDEFFRVILQTLLWWVGLQELKEALRDLPEMESNDEPENRAMNVEYRSALHPLTRDLVAAILEDGCPSREAMLAFGIETEWHFEALFYPFWEGDFSAEQLDEARGDGEKLTELVFTAPNNPHRFITFIIREKP